MINERKNPHPILLPSSYNDKYGNIVYEVSAILDQVFWSTKEIVREEFKVVCDVDLNKYPEAEVPPTYHLYLTVVSLNDNI